jgi:uncharacterized repeat protein (TIGR01451 family)
MSRPFGSGRALGSPPPGWFRGAGISGQPRLWTQEGRDRLSSLCAYRYNDLTPPGGGCKLRLVHALAPGSARRNIRQPVLLSNGVRIVSMGWEREIGKAADMMSSEPVTGLFRMRPTRLLGIVAMLVIGALLVFLAKGGPAAPAAGTPDPADLSLTKADSPDPVTEGSQLTYTINVSNAGPDAPTNVAVTDNLSSRLDFVSATASSGSCKGPTGKGHGGKVTCNLGTVANAGTATVTIIVTPNKAGTVSNTASVASEVIDPQANNNSDTEATTVNKAPAAPTCFGKEATIVGTSGDDVLTGTDGKDVIVARAGRDQVSALGNKDLVCSRGGADLVDAGPDADRVSGARGRDVLKGRSGGDELRGGRGRDRLRGNSGNDLLRGGRGRDRCRGGPGSDTVISCER